MCKIIVGLQKEKSAEFRDLIQTQYDDLKLEKDGIGVLAIMKDGTTRIVRTVDDYDVVYEKIDDMLDDVRMIAIHTRTATSGAKDLSNVHFFEENGVYLAHNGFVSGVFNKTLPKPKRDEKRKENGTAIIETNGKIERPKAIEEKSIVVTNKTLSDLDKMDAEMRDLEQIMFSCANCDDERWIACKKHKSVENRLTKLQEDFYMNGRVEDNDTPPLDDSDDRVITVGSGNSGKHAGFHGVGSGESYYNSHWNTGLADSHKFLKILVDQGEVTEKTITETARDNGFSGFLVVYDSNNGKMFLLVQKEVHSISDDEKYHALFSYSPELDMKKYTRREVMGIEVVSSEEKKIEREDRSVVYGVHELQILEIPKTKVEKKVKVHAK